MNYKVNKVELDYKPVFSILIPSWNNLAYLVCLVDSIRKNSTYKHQILVHINDGFDGTEFWVANQRDIGYTMSAENSGVCFGFNAISHLAESDLLVLLDDDLYLCPKWDEYLMDEIKMMPDEKWCMSSTMIEPRKNNNPCVIEGKNFGRNIYEFNELNLLLQYESFKKKDWNGSQWYPLILPTFVYRAIGGLSIEFSPGMYSDPDFMMKLWQYGVRYYKGVSKSRAYHFGSISTGRIKKNKGRRTFIWKWGMSAITFFRNYLALGAEFQGYMGDVKETWKLRFIKRIDRWKVRFKNRAGSTAGMF